MSGSNMCYEHNETGWGNGQKMLPGVRGAVSSSDKESLLAQAMFVQT